MDKKSQSQKLIPKLFLNRRGQTGGLITSIVFGIASLIIGVIVAFLIVATLGNANLLDSGRTTATTTNETGYINTTGYTLSNFDTATTASVSISEAWNVTNTSNVVLIPAANYTVSQTSGIVTNGTVSNYDDVNFTYVITTKSNEEQSTDNLDANFTEGVDRVSEQISTVLLIAAIILILSVLAILVGVWRRLNLSGEGTL